MNRTGWLQDRRMQKFRDILSRWERGALSMMEAGELPMIPVDERNAEVRAIKSGLIGWDGVRSSPARTNRL
jgi:hypothetical protein